MLYFVLASMLSSPRQLVALEWIKGCFVVLFFYWNQRSFISIFKYFEICSTFYSLQGTLKFAGYFTLVSNLLFRQTLVKAVEWLERQATFVYVEFSVPETMSPFAESRGSFAMWTQNQSMFRYFYFSNGPFGVKLVFCRRSLPLLGLYAGQRAGSLYHSEKSGQFLFLMPPSCTPERRGLGVC